MKNKRLGWGIAAGVAIILLVLFAVWFWSLGTAHAGQPPAIRIESVKQPVEWHHADETIWSTLADGVDAQAGDTVRTGEGGEARIVWGDRGTTRVDGGSELTLETIPANGSLDPGAQIKMKLEGGRIWSRVIKLLDLGSSMQVDSSAVVATVRGTSFGAAVVPEGAEFAVTESVVDVAGASGTRTLLRDNQWGDFDKGGSPRIVRALLPTDEWAARNREQDAREERDELSIWRKRLEERASSLKNAPAFLLDASESFHLALASGDQKQELATAYAERRLALLSTENRPQDASRFRGYVTLAGLSRGRLLGEWHGLATLRGRTGEGDVAAARIWRTELAPASIPDRAYLDAVAIDDRIDDVLAAPGTRDQAVIKGIRSDIDTFENKIDALDASPDEKGGLHRKAEALRVRIDGVGDAPIVEAPPIPAPEIPPTPGTQLPDTVKRPPALLKPAPTTTPTSASYVRYQLLASPSSVTIGQTVNLTMFGITSAGQADDVTSRTSFNAASGAFSGNTFIPSVAGTITLNGMVDGKTVSTAITVSKTAPVTTTGLQGISLQFTGPTVMACSAYSAFKVIASYADGKTADVTMLSKLSVTDPKVIYVNVGSLMSFCTVDVATADVVASYTENQVTKGASQTITVARDPAAITKDCTRRYCP
jgi:hypothetical protein